MNLATVVVGLGPPFGARVGASICGPSRRSNLAAVRLRFDRGPSIECPSAESGDNPVEFKPVGFHTEDGFRDRQKGSRVCRFLPV